MEGLARRALMAAAWEDKRGTVIRLKAIRYGKFSLQIIVAAIAQKELDSVFLVFLEGAS
jgi:hypothetical protein